MDPETRLSLLARLRNASDDAAWAEFVELYLPVIYRSARILGMQDADAQDVTQQVLLSVSKALQTRPHDPERAKFRTWLGNVTRNTSLNLLQRAKPDRATGDSQQLQFLNAQAAPADAEAVLNEEYEKELFRTVARSVQSEFSEDSWKAFWWTTIDGRPIAEVAEALGKQVGSIYAARSRVIRRLREEVDAREED